MHQRKSIASEAREALEHYKMEMAKEISVNHDDPADFGYLASFHTGIVTKKLVEEGEKILIEKYNSK